MGKRVDVRATATVVEIFRHSRRVASHRRSYVRGGFTTDPAHRPDAHRRYAEWTPSRLIRWAETIGPATAAVVRQILERRPHPEQGFRSCLGILSLARRHDAARVEQACRRAHALGAASYRSVKSILTHGLDRQPLPAPPTGPALAHEHIRGPAYYHPPAEGDDHDDRGDVSETQ